MLARKKENFYEEAPKTGYSIPSGYGKSGYGDPSELGYSSPVFSDEYQSQDRKGIVLFPRHIVLLWIGVGVGMVLAFVFGLYAGRTQGIRLALEESTVPSIRLPIALENELKNQPIAALPLVAQTTLSATLPADSSKDKELAKELAVASVRPPVEVKSAPPIIISSSVQSSPKLSDTKPVEVKPVEKVVAKPVEKLIPKIANQKLDGVFVQVAAPNNRRQAEIILSRLESKGVKATIKEASVNDLLHFRVLAGPYKNKLEAAKNRDLLAKITKSNTKPFVKLPSAD
jgi:cell division septation protein DedD